MSSESNNIRASTPPKPIRPIQQICTQCNCHCNMNGECKFYRKRVIKNDYSDITPAMFPNIMRKLTYEN